MTTTTGIFSLDLFQSSENAKNMAPSPQEVSAASSQNMTKYSKFMQRQPYIATEPTYLHGNILLNKYGTKHQCDKKRITCDSNPPGSRSGRTSNRTIVPTIVTKL